MKWIKYKIEQCVVNGQSILIDKKLGYNEVNIAIAQDESYNGEYTIEEDDKEFDKEPLDIEFGGTGAKTLEDARKNLGISKITYGLQSAGYPENPVEGQIHIFYEE